LPTVSSLWRRVNMAKQLSFDEDPLPWLAAIAAKETGIEAFRIYGGW